MLVSAITVSDIVDYLRLDETQYTTAQIQSYLSAAKAFVKAYTGLDDTAIDLHEDIVIVIYVLCQDMYDNRTLYVEKNNINQVVDSILGMHSINLL